MFYLVGLADLCIYKELLARSIRSLNKAINRLLGLCIVLFAYLLIRLLDILPLYFYPAEHRLPTPTTTLCQSSDSYSTSLQPLRPKFLLILAPNLTGLCLNSL